MSEMTGLPQGRRTLVDGAIVVVAVLAAAALWVADNGAPVTAWRVEHTARPGGGAGRHDVVNPKLTTARRADHRETRGDERAAGGPREWSG
jgi:hypothetical protein